MRAGEGASEGAGEGAGEGAACCAELPFSCSGPQRTGRNTAVSRPSRLTIGVCAGGAVAVGAERRVRAFGAALAVLGALVAGGGALRAAALGVHKVSQGRAGLGGAALRAHRQVACRGGNMRRRGHGWVREVLSDGRQAWEDVGNAPFLRGCSATCRNVGPINVPQRGLADHDHACNCQASAVFQPSSLPLPAQAGGPHRRRRRSSRPCRAGTRRQPGRTRSGSSGRCPAQQAGAAAGRRLSHWRGRQPWPLLIGPGPGQGLLAGPTLLGAGALCCPLQLALLACPPARRTRRSPQRGSSRRRLPRRRSPGSRRYGRRAGRPVGRAGAGGGSRGLSVTGSGAAGMGCRGQAGTAVRGRGVAAPACCVAAVCTCTSPGLDAECFVWVHPVHAALPSQVRSPRLRPPPPTSQYKVLVARHVSQFTPPASSGTVHCRHRGAVSTGAASGQYATAVTCLDLHRRF